MKEDTVQYSYNEDNNNESLYILVNDIPYLLTKWFCICGVPVLTYPDNFPQKINNSLHRHNTMAVLPSTPNHLSPMILFNFRFLENKNFSPYNVLSIILHEVGHIAGEKQNSIDKMEREFGADEFAAKHIGKDCLLETIEKDMLYLSSIPQDIETKKRMQRLTLKKRYLYSCPNLPSGTNKEILFEVFPNKDDLYNFIKLISKSSSINGTFANNKLK